MKRIVVVTIVMVVMIFPSVALAGGNLTNRFADQRALRLIAESENVQTIKRAGEVIVELFRINKYCSESVAKKMPDVEKIMQTGAAAEIKAARAQNNRQLLTSLWHELVSNAEFFGEGTPAYKKLLQDCQ